MKPFFIELFQTFAFFLLSRPKKNLDLSFRLCLCNNYLIRLGFTGSIWTTHFASTSRPSSTGWPSTWPRPSWSSPSATPTSSTTSSTTQGRVFLFCHTGRVNLCCSKGSYAFIKIRNTQTLSLQFIVNRFPRRGLWYDRELGNLLKVDQFGKILICCHGFKLLRGQQLRSIHPSIHLSIFLSFLCQNCFSSVVGFSTWTTTCKTFSW